LNRYVSKEYLECFLASFVFFFFIFFVNQILVLVRKVLLKNVSFDTMLTLVFASIPQFLLYVIPFSTLSASSMLLGNLGSSNELLALRSVGIPMRKVFKPLLAWSLALALLCFYVADVLVPYSAAVYKNMLRSVMRDLPTFELKSNSVNRVGSIILSNGKAEGSHIESIVLFDRGDDERKTIKSDSGNLELIDPTNFIYRFTLGATEFALTEENINNWSYAKSDSATLALNFSSQVPALTTTSPGNLTSRELMRLSGEKREQLAEDKASFHLSKDKERMRLAEKIGRASSKEVAESLRKSIDDSVRIIETIGAKEPMNFYYQYYSAELFKKSALSFACIALTIVSLPLSFVRLKHGRLLGFGLSLLIAVSYWYILFFCQLELFDIRMHGGFMVWIPNFVMLLLGSALLLSRRRS